MLKEKMDEEKRRGEGTNKVKELSEEEEEEDFMSDSFLSGAATATSVTKRDETYSEKRRREINAAKERGKIQSRIEREKEARRLGLSKNLMGTNKDTNKEQVGGSKRGREGENASSSSTPAPANKAMKMMLAMGYQQGEGLGKKADLYDENVSGDNKKEEAEAAENSSKSAKVITEPLAIDERWLGARARAGIGKMSAISAQALSQDISKAFSNQVNQENTTSAEDQFRQRSGNDHKIRHYERLLVDARSTCQDLDQKLGVKFSPLWINPESLSKQADQLPDHVAGLIEYAFLGLHAKGSNDNEEGEGEEEEDNMEALARAKETKQFCLLQAKARLEITLSHLRRTHHYCLFCGHRYESLEELEQQCPGEDEDDH